jgi:hypothetical protein
MKLVTAAALPLLLVLGSVAQAANCVYPQAPTKLPNGASSTKDEMVAANGTMKEYSKSVQEVYLPCLAQEETDAIAALDPADPEFAQKKAAAEAIHAKKHNAALDELEAVAARWSEEIKAFKAKDTK